MSEESADHSPAPEAPSEASESAELKPSNDSPDTRTEAADSLLTVIQGFASETKAHLRSAELAASESEAQCGLAREAAQAVTQAVESTKAQAAEMAKLVEAARAASVQATEAAALATANLASTKTAGDAVSSTAALIEGLKTKVEQAAQVAETRSAHIEDGRIHADGVRADIDKHLNAAQQSASKAASHEAASASTLESLKSALTEAASVRAKAEAQAQAAAAARAAVDGHAVVTKKLSELAESIESRVSQYEAKLTEIQSAAAKQREIIDELLAGATNAGLAAAFDKRSRVFKAPEIRWQRIFIGSLAGLLLLALWQAIAYRNLDPTANWEHLVRMLVVKLPFVIPLVWLAVHAARQASFAKRMEEEYAFKATTSMSFQGFRREMAEVGKDLSPESPLAHLCNNTLRTIAAPPGNIYDKHRMDPTPGTAASEFVTPVVNGVSKVLAKKLPDLAE